MTPPAKRLLPPDSSTFAASSIATLTPASRAVSAAHSAALPLPTTTTSYCLSFSSAIWPSGSHNFKQRRELPQGVDVLERLDPAARRGCRFRLHRPRGTVLELGSHVLGRY